MSLMLLVSLAQAVTPQVGVVWPIAGHPILDVRMGALRSDATPHPYVCVEGSPLAQLSVEGCGTGSGFLYPADGRADLAHFRARLRVVTTSFRRVDGSVGVGLGITELDRGEDSAGFRFDRTGPNEGAGPEGSVGVKGRLWFHSRAYFVLDVTAGAAWIPAAPAILGEGDAWIPFGALSVGAGF